MKHNPLNKFLPKVEKTRKDPAFERNLRAVKTLAVKTLSYYRHMARDMPIGSSIGRGWTVVGPAVSKGDLIKERWNQRRLDRAARAALRQPSDLTI